MSDRIHEVLDQPRINMEECLERKWRAREREKRFAETNFGLTVDYEKQDMKGLILRWSIDITLISVGGYQIKLMSSLW